MTTDFTFERAAAWEQVGEALQLALEDARRAESMEDLDERAALAMQSAREGQRQYSKFEWMPQEIDRLLTERGFRRLSAAELGFVDHIKCTM